MVLMGLLTDVSRMLTRRQPLLLAGGGAAAFALIFTRFRREQEANRKRLAAGESAQGGATAASGDNPRKKVAVNAEFFRRLRSLLRIVIPNLRCKEFLILCLHSFFLVSRTMMSIYVAQLDGRIVKSIVDRQLSTFIALLVRWMVVAVPATYINSMIQYLEAKLAIAFRTRLVKHVYEMYMADETYYRIGNLDSRLSNPDQCLTEDVSTFCTDLAHIYSHLSKPCLDVVLMAGQLILLARHRAGGDGHTGQPVLLAALVIFGSGYILKLATPPFGKMIAEQARLYGDLRAAHSRVIAHSEEIAFYGGHVIERTVLQQTYDDLIRHINFIYRKKIWFTMLEQFLMRYLWGACGLVMIAQTSFARSQVSPADSRALVDTATDNVSTRTQEFVTSRGLLISTADAIERMMSSWKDVTELAGRTARIYEMIDIFEQVKRGEYVKAQGNGATLSIEEIKEGEEEAAAEGDASPSETETATSPAEGQSPAAPKKVRLSPASPSHLVSVSPNTSLYTQGGGIVHDNSDFIEVSRVPLVTPNGDMLLDAPYLSFTIKRGMHLLVTGPNGCGKSSLFRMLGGLWPVRGGLMRKPGKGDIYNIPQRPYLTNASLRSQFIYPDSEADFFAAGHTDADLTPILEMVALTGVVEREGGLDACKDWRDVLSGGESQRVALGRVFYMKPAFAILDECTSAVSIDVEGQMYQGLIDAGITLLTVTHRPSLFKYHTHLLQFSGTGTYKFSELNATARLSLAEEKNKLEAHMAGIPAVQKRLKELCDLLGQSSLHVQKTNEQESS